MPRLMPTTLRPRFRAQARGGGLLRHVPNRPPRFPTSTPPPGPSARPSGFSIRSQQDSIGFNPTAFKAPVRTSVATEFNSGERRYYTTNPGAVTLRALGAGLARTVDCGTPPAGTLRGVSRRSPKRGLLRPLRGSACGLGQPDRFATGACRVLASRRLPRFQQQAALSLPCLGVYHWLRMIRLLRLRAKTTPLVRPSP